MNALSPYFRCFCILSFLLFILSSPSFASRTSAYKALKNGDYQTGLAEIIPMAKNGDVWAQYVIAKMYQFGQGLPQDYKKAVDWYLKIGALAHLNLGENEKLKIPTLRKLGMLYSEEKWRKHDFKQAIKWLTQAAQLGDSRSQALLGLFYKIGRGVKRNPAAAQKWLKVSTKGLNEEGLNEKAKKIIPILNELNVAGFLKARAKWRSKFPAYMKPFGIVLGKRFPAELSYNLKTTFNNNDNPARNMYAGVEPPKPFPGKLEDADSEEEYSAYSTKKSDTVYKVSANLRFDSEAQCRKALTAYYKNGPGSGIRPKIRKKWSKVSGSRLFVADFKVLSSPAGTQEPLKIKNADNLSGVRLVLSCSGASGKIAFIHYPSVEKRIAESIRNIPLLAGYFNNQDSGRKRPDYLNLFGIALGKPLPASVRKSKKDADFRFNMFAIKPRGRRHKLFTHYTASTTPLTNSVMRLRAHSDKFENRKNCVMALDGFSKGLLKKHNASISDNSNSLGVEFTLLPSGIELERSTKTRFGFMQDGEIRYDFAKGENRMDVSVYCVRKDGNHWRGVVEYTHPLTEAIAETEQRVLNPY